jgi:NADH:ubiquinone oxidoreductase subunit K
MMPVTHYLYLALGLFGIGLAGAVLRRSLIAALLGVELMLAAVALCFCAYARMFVDATGQIAALLVVLVGLCELGVIVAIVLRSLREAHFASPGEDPGDRLLDDWSGRPDEQGER